MRCERERESEPLFERGLRDTLSSQKNLFKEKARLWKEGPENYLKIKTTQQITDQWKEEAEDWVCVGVRLVRNGREATTVNHRSQAGLDVRPSQIT